MCHASDDIMHHDLKQLSILRVGDRRRVHLEDDGIPENTSFSQSAEAVQKSGVSNVRASAISWHLQTTTNIINTQ